MAYRRKRSDIPLHVTYQNLRDGVVGDQRNCTFGQCAMSREKGMVFVVDIDPENPKVYAEWPETVNGVREHHRADVVRRHPDGTETTSEAFNVVFATDVVKKKLLRKFPKRGMDFVLTNHTAIKSDRNSHALQPGETEGDREARLERYRERRNELKRLREEGLVDPPKPRQRRVRARFS